MPQTEPETDAPEHQYLLSDLDKMQKRAVKSKYLEASKEFGEETYPMLQEVVTHFGGRLERLEAALDELIDETESFLQPDLAQQILTTMDLAKQLAEGFLAVQGPIDDTTRKRLQQLAAAYLTAHELTAESVGEVVAGAPEEDDTDPDAEPDDEEEEEDEEQDEGVTPVDAAPEEK